MENVTWHRIAVILGILSLLGITYSSILVNNFKTPESTANFLKNSNTFYYVAEIIKTNIRENYNDQIKNNIIQGSVADQILDIVVTPERVERLAMPALQASARIKQLPLSFVESNLVINTQQYTSQASNTLATSQLPTAVIDAGQNLIASVPPQITVVNTQENPNSVIAFITSFRIFLDNAQTLLTISWIVLFLSLLGLIFFNLKNIQRLINGLFWVFVITGVILLILSYLLPAISSSTTSNLDPLTGVLKDDLVDGIVDYYFSLSRTAGLIYIIVGAIFYLLYRFIPFDKVQDWINSHLFSEQATAKAR